MKEAKRLIAEWDRVFEADEDYGEILTDIIDFLRTL